MALAKSLSLEHPGMNEGRGKRERGLTRSGQGRGRICLSSTGGSQQLTDSSILCPMGKTPVPQGQWAAETREKQRGREGGREHRCEKHPSLVSCIHAPTVSQTRNLSGGQNDAPTD